MFTVSKVIKKKPSAQGNTSISWQKQGMCYVFEIKVKLYYKFSLENVTSSFFPFFPQKCLLFLQFSFHLV